MAAGHDDYKRLETPTGQTLEPCPVCAAAAEVWQLSEVEKGTTSKVVMCSNGLMFGPQDGVMNEGCLLYMPPNDFYCPTVREAVKYWNEYAKALEKQRRARRWETAKVLRQESPNAKLSGPAKRSFDRSA